MSRLERCNQHVSLPRGDGPPGRHKWGFFCARKKKHKGDCGPYPDAEDQGVAREVDSLAIHKKIARVEKQIAKLRADRDALEPSAKIKCLGNTVGMGDGCGAETPVKDLVYIESWHYSCGEWELQEGGFDCPKCGKRNRLYERPEVDKLKYIFKAIAKEDC